MGKGQGEKLRTMLVDALEKERTSLKHKIPFDLRDEDKAIGPSLRDEAVRWLFRWNTKMRYNSETFLLSTAILDNFLSTVKAKPKYMECIAICSFYLGIKMKEEDEVIPSTHDLIRITQSRCGVTDIHRMERIILDKLGWNINFVTALDFLNIFHALLIVGTDMRASLGEMYPAYHRQILTQRLQQCVTSHSLVKFRGSVLALALISLDLECLLPDWLSILIMMQRVIQTDNNQVIRCREAITTYLSSQPGTGYITQQKHQQIQQQDQQQVKIKMPSSFGSAFHSAQYHRHRAKKPNKRKVEQIEVDEIYDSIKRLYNDDNSQDVVMASAPSTPVSCSHQHRHDEDGPVVATCTPMQIVEAN
ncbi:cyclin-I-like [Ptychodera flava]|uniref:cyclin-I-like n=1 Tax=Ptychodera flava TaxID=63121 RepID=UPI00396A50C2